MLETEGDTSPARVRLAVTVMAVQASSYPNGFRFGYHSFLARYVQLGACAPCASPTPEAGHLAQNLGLVAATLNLRLGLIGGFYDDLAHDILTLDGVDNSLVYLLPLAA